jgi:hypothetical protein
MLRNDFTAIGVFSAPVPFTRSLTGDSPHHNFLVVLSFSLLGTTLSLVLPLLLDPQILSVLSEGTAQHPRGIAYFLPQIAHPSASEAT